MAWQRPDNAAAKGDWTASEDAAQFPILTAFLSDTEPVNGKRREPGTVLLFYKDGRLHFCLNDKHDRMVGWGTFQQLSSVAEAIEVMLMEAKVDWRSASTRR